MAIVKNFWLKNQTKKLAGAVIYQAMGQTRSRELASEISNPRTVDQMSQRVRWSNLVNFYRANKSWMKFAFETKPSNRTDYNQFMSLNAGTSTIYLPKNLANQGACIVSNYRMTQGSLGSIEVLPYEGNWQTNLYFPDDFLLGDITTVAEFAEALISQNPGIREGDQLSFIRMTQQTNSSTGVPFVVIRKYEIILKTDDLRFVRQFLPLAYFDVDQAGENTCLVVQNSGTAGGFLLVLSRTVGGKTYVSTQSIIVANNDALISQYSSAAALQEAIDSYGESSEPFLTSTTAEQDTQAPVGASVLSVELNGTRYGVGGVAYPVTYAEEDEISLYMSEEVTGSASNILVTFVKGGQEYKLQFNYVETVGNKIVISTFNTDGIADAALADIVFNVDGHEYRAPFIVPNAATQGGLE